MVRKTLLLVSIFFILSSLFVFAEIDESDVNYFLEKLATTEDQEKRDTGVWVLETYMDADETDLKGLKLFIKNTADDEDIQKLENQGYTLDEAVDSLDILGEMSRDDIQTLISAIGNQDLEAMQEVIDSYYQDESKEASPELVKGEQTGVPLEEAPVIAEELNLKEVKFKDIDEHWAKDNISFLAEREVISGYSVTEFQPDKSISRAEFTTLVVKLLNFQSLDENVLAFDDINSNNWFYTYIKAAKDNGIISGINEKNFMPNGQITREQMVHIIINALEKANKLGEIDMSTAEQMISSFDDKDTISDWAKANFTKAVGLGIIKGRSNTELDPKANLTRAEAATIIRSVYDLINK